MLLTQEVEISKDEYQRLKAESHEVRDKAIAQIAIKSGWHPAGYGFYYPRLKERNGKYYAVWDRGSSCD